MSAMLRLMAEDGGDLEIVAAAVQDALLRVGETVRDSRARRFTLMLNRFRWEHAGQDGPFERVRAALSFESVLGVKSRRVRQDAPDAFAAILSLGFEPAAEPPAGIVRVVLAGGGEIAIEVECLDVLLVDLGPVWATPRRPDHEKA